MATATAAAAPPAPPALATLVPRTIAPLAGIPFVAATLVGLTIAIATNSIWALNFFHVAGGAGWTALDLFLGFVLGPIIGGMSPPARAEFSARFMPKMLLLMPTLVTMTLASGFQVARHFAFLDTSYPRHGWIVASFIVVGVMATVALGFLEPANVAVLFEMRKPEPNFELIGRLMKRFVYAAGILGAMQVATLLIMTRLPT
jgi:hypothetical protein